MVFEDENGEPSHENQPDEEAAEGFAMGCVEATSVELQLELAVSLAAEVVGGEREANGVGLGPLFFSHASLVAWSTGHASMGADDEEV